MADYHILKISVDGRNATVVMHLPVPATDNIAEVPFRDAVRYSQDSTASILNDVDSNEQNKMDSGELFEKVIEFRFTNVDLTHEQRVFQVENGNYNVHGVKYHKAAISTPDTETYDEILKPLDEWGTNGDVVGDLVDEKEKEKDK